MVAGTVSCDNNRAVPARGENRPTILKTSRNCCNVEALEQTAGFGLIVPVTENVPRTQGKLRISYAAFTACARISTPRRLRTTPKIAARLSMLGLPRSDSMR